MQQPMWGAAPYRRRGLAALALALIAIGFSTISGGAGAATSTSTATSAATALVGDATSETGSDNIPSGTAEAYSYTASASGTLQTAHVYVRPGTTATRLTVGLYSDAGGKPGTLLSTCTISSPAAGAWSTCSAGGTVASGSKYWIALLPTGGGLSYATTMSAASQANSNRALAALPSAWTAGTNYTDGPASAFFDGSAPSAPPPDTTPPTTPTGLTKTSSTGTSISVSWNASTDNSGVAGYGVYLNSAGATTPGSLVGSSTSTAMTLSGLSCGKSYNVSVDAFDAAGNRSGKTTITTSTSACVTSGSPGGSPSPGSTDTTPPSPVSGLQVQGATANSVTLAWNPATDNVGVAGYNLLKSGTKVGSTTSLTYTYTGLACGTTYTLAVQTYDAAGNTSNPAFATISGATTACSTAPSDTTAPSPVSGLNVQSSTTTSVTLAWIAATDNVGVAGYNMLQNGVKVGSTPNLTYTYTGLTCGRAYTFAVQTYDAAGNTSDPAYATISGTTAICPSAPAPAPLDTQPPTAPSNLRTTGATGSTITLAWDASTDNVGVVSYGIYNGSTTLTSIPSLTYTVGGLTCGTTYTLSVDAADAAGNRSPQTSVTAATAACPTADTQAPTAPTNVVVTGATQSSITLSWNAATDNVGVTGYEVYNGATVSGTTSSLSYTVSGLSCGTTYTLAVDATDAAGNRSGKTTASAATSACVVADTQAPTAPTGLVASSATTSSITLSWKASTDNVGVVSYGVYNGATTVSSTTLLGYTVTGLACGTSYTLSVDAADAAGNRSPKTSVSATTSTCPPAGTGIFIAPTGSDSNPCTSLAPCKSFARGYAVANPGSTVNVAAGLYPAQSIQYSAAKAGATSRVVFQCAPAFGSIIGSGTSGLSLNGAQHIELVGCDLRGDFGAMAQDRTSASSPEVTDVVVRDGRMQSFHITSVHDFTISGNDIGHYSYDDGFGSNSIYSDTGLPASTNVKVVDNVFNGITISTPSHDECLFINGVDGLTIAQNMMLNCPGLAIAFYDSQTRYARNILVENNFLQCRPRASCYGGDQVIELDTKGTQSFSNVTIRFNSADGSMAFLGDSGGLYSNARAYGNAVTSISCPSTVPDWKIDYNVGSSCGGTNKSTLPVYVNQIGGDLHTLLGAPQVDLIPSSFCASAGCPSSDIDGQPRPAGAAYDAGADELY
jgi:chitodextrinase